MSPEIQEWSQTNSRTGPIELEVRKDTRPVSENMWLIPRSRWVINTILYRQYDIAHWSMKAFVFDLTDGYQSHYET